MESLPLGTIRISRSEDRISMASILYIDLP
jgi:hypothetical protein